MSCSCMTVSADDLCRAMSATEGMLSLWDDMLWEDAKDPHIPLDNIPPSELLCRQPRLSLEVVLHTTSLLPQSFDLRP